MKIINRVTTFLILIIVFHTTVIQSQVVVETSKDKVIISGVPYYIHLVKKGETAYSISRAYGISVEMLTKENPPALYGVNEGQKLRIPVKPADLIVPAATSPVKKLHDDAKYIYHTLKPGETIFSISKSYGVSENEIILSNTGIEINKLPVGSEIAVPRREFMSERQKFDEPEKKYLFHKVMKGESLTSIAEKYGLTVRELRKENRDLRFPQVGDFVRVPGVFVEEVKEKEQVKKDSVPALAEEPVLKVERPAGYTEVKELRGSLNVAVLLPFYLKENSIRTELDSSKRINGKKIPPKVVKKPEEWIYPSLDFVEMYEGILLAADTLRSLGLDINISPFDIKGDTTELTKLIMSGKLAGMDLIIGPVYSYNLSIVAAYARDLGIPVVSPVSLVNNASLIKNPTLFMANSSIEVAQRRLAKEISRYSDHNIVFYYSDTTGVDEDVKRFKSLIFTELSYKLPYENIKFKELQFYSRTMFDNDSINRLSHSLSEQSKNIVIIASEEAPVINEIVDDVYGLSKKFDIKLFGYPVIRDLDNLDQKELFDLDFLIHYPYWIDYTKEDVKQFNLDFREKFFTEPSPRSYAWQGYDIAYYFISGLAMLGKDFIANPTRHNPDLLQTEYYFERKEAGDGFENQKFYVIRYTKVYEVKLLEEN